MINSPKGIWLCDKHATGDYLNEIWGLPLRRCEAQGCDEYLIIKKYRKPRIND